MVDNRSAFSLFLLLGLAAPAAFGQERVALGPDFQVNTFDLGGQFDPAVAVSPEGAFAVVWDSDLSPGTDPDAGIQARLYTASGLPAGPAFEVNSVTAGAQLRPDVALDPDGGLVAVWESAASAGSDSSGFSIQARPFAADGTPLGDDFQVNTTTDGDQRSAAVARAADGSFVVAFRSDGAPEPRILARLFAADGTPLGDDFPVSTATAVFHLTVDVGLDEDGDMVIVWDELDGDDAVIRARRFTAAGDPLGDPFQVNVSAVGPQAFPAVAVAPGGAFTVVWSGAGADEVFDARARFFSADGTPLGPDVLVNSTVAGDAFSPAVAVAENGEHTIVWQVTGATGGDPGGGIRGRRFSPAGLPQGADFAVNSHTPGSQERPAIAVAEDGDLVIAWDSGSSAGSDGDGRSIQARRFSDCTGSRHLCLNDERFHIETAFETNAGFTGAGRREPLTADTGYFWFFDPDNVELVIKVLDACSFADRFWVFAGGLTNVEVDLAVTDTVTGAIRTYRNPQLTAFQPIQDTDAFATCAGLAQAPPQVLQGAPRSEVLEERAADAAEEIEGLLGRPANPLAPHPAAGEATELFLNGGRFRVTTTFETFAGDTGDGESVQLTDDTGYFWFFQEENVELVIKVLDACTFADRFWVFAGGLTNVQVEITVEDTMGGATASYENPQRTPFQPIQDTDAFATCP